VSATAARLTIIVVSSRDEAASIRQKLQAGASFDALATQYSKHPSAATGGEFGVFPLSDLRPEYRAALEGVRSGGYTDVIAVPSPVVPQDWPESLPAPGATLRDVELALGRSYSAVTLHADGESTMQELTYGFGVRLRIHERRGLGFIEFTPPWKFAIFGIRPDDPLPGPIYDLFPRNGRFIRGVYAAIPGHANWFVDVDDRVDAVMQLLFVDRRIYGDLPGLPKNN
jgi:parvulin-like peptidyl-prolyl cis-trans isomerase-like protein